jgi:hypothetical protein
MSRQIPLPFAILAILLSSVQQVYADDDVRILLKKLSQQVIELKNHSEKSDARIRELELSLENERGKNQQLTIAGAVPKIQRATLPPADQSIASKKENGGAVTLGDVKGTFKISGTDTSLGFGGYVKLDLIENSVSAGTNKIGDQYLFIPQIPISHSGEGSQLTFTARESRFWLKSFTPHQLGDINTYLEFDLYSSADAYTPRLRHAYGTFGNLLAGQTWTTFVNELAMPDTLDISGPVGSIKIRQPLLRWTQPFTVANVSFDLQLAAESPNSVLWTKLWSPVTPETLTTGGGDRYPDIVARLNYKPTWGALSLAGMGRQIRITPTTIQGNISIPNVTTTNEAWGSAVSLAGKINTFELDNVRFTLNYGNAFGRYSSVDHVEDAAVDVAGNLHLVNSYSAVIAYQHWWDKAWRSNLAYGFEQAEQPLFVDQNMTRQAQSVHVNLLWNPLPQATLGLEYIYGSRELLDGRNGNLHRAQFSTKYNF